MVSLLFADTQSVTVVCTKRRVTLSAILLVCLLRKISTNIFRGVLLSLSQLKNI